jgi:lycopene beta-cyclase
MRQYDFIMAGGGVAGLSLAYHLVHSPLRHRSILIIDTDAKDRNDRTLCFWSDRPGPFSGIVHHSWKRLQVVTEGSSQAFDLTSYRYNMIRSIDLYRFVKRELAKYPNVEFLRATVERIEDCGNGAKVWARVPGGSEGDGRAYWARWVFDSRYNKPKLEPDPASSRKGTRHLWQQFVGWQIETHEPAFDPEIATFLDFRTPQKGQMRFLYKLPLSENRALVEFVVCAAQPIKREDCEQALGVYLGDVLGIKAYRITSEEAGINPLTDQPFPRQIGPHTMAIGILGGRIKPSTGYAFSRIQADSAAIVDSLVRTGQPFDIPSARRHYRFFDSVLLDMMCRQGGETGDVLAALMRKTGMERSFRFLDESETPLELLSSVPSIPRPLIRATLDRLALPLRFERSKSCAPAPLQ